MKQNYKKSTNKAKQNKTPKINTNKKDDANVLRTSFFLIHILVKVKRCMIKWEYELYVTRLHGFKSNKKACNLASIMQNICGL